MTGRRQTSRRSTPLMVCYVARAGPSRAKRGRSRRCERLPRGRGRHGTNHCQGGSGMRRVLVALASAVLLGGVALTTVASAHEGGEDLHYLAEATSFEHSK